MMKLGNASASALAGWVVCALLAVACDEEGSLGAGSGGSPMAAAGGPSALPEPGPSVASPTPVLMPPPNEGMASVVPSDCPPDRDVLERAALATYAIVFGALGAENEPNPIFTATAFAVGPNLLATNAHVTRGLEEMIAQVGYEDVVAVQAGTGTVVPLELAVSHPGFNGDPLGEPDVGLLTTRAVLPSVLELAPANGVTRVGVTDDVYVVGFPSDVDEAVPTIPGQTIPQATALPGDVTALRNFDPNVAVTQASADIIQHDAATSPGMSGAPMLNCGVVIGVNNAGTVKQILTSDADGNLRLDRVGAASNNFGIDIKHLHGLLSQFEQGTLAAFDLGSHPPPMAPVPMAPAPMAPAPPPSVGDELCLDTCVFAGDAECDDGGPNALPVQNCAFGTDCTDCGPRQAPAASDWLVFTDPATGEVCDTVNGADFEAVVILPSRELMLVNVFDLAGTVLTTDTVVSGLTVDESGNIVADGALTGGRVSFALDGDGLNRVWVLLPDGTLSASAAELAGLTPGALTDIRCDACGAVDQPPALRCP
jgi:hypothetical protein